ncbi:MAG: SUMF1/EgtB/PvdO family nonheme iron enzyme [Terriglobia bacterium]
MDAAIPHDQLRHSLQTRLGEARAHTDALFRLVRPEALHDRPIPERHRVVFYLGHLEAFDWNLVCRGAFNRDSFHEEFDRLFAFGIDPVDGSLPTDRPSDWPPLPDIATYNQRVRACVDTCLEQAPFSQPKQPALENGIIFHVAIEHRLTHAETLAYMLHHLPIERKVPPPIVPEPPAPPVAPRTVEIPAGTATLGLARSNHDCSFGWDNEFEAHAVEVPSFSIDVYNVTNGQFLEFLHAGGYQDRTLWTESDWEWKSKHGITHPSFWRRRGQRWYQQNMFAEISLPLDCPVYTSHAEATAYARWAGKSLPTEAQLHRAAYGTHERGERAYPWGDDAPAGSCGNFNFHRWDPAPVGAYPAGRSAFGVADLLGNGWEWTSTLFEPFQGFQPFPFYPGYSANFFDGKHYVIKGASARTAACLLRRSFRNWFQPHYPYIYAAFRCVEN